MTELVRITHLALYAVVMSQPLFYLVAFAQASSALSAPAYIEVRHHLNRIMNRRVPVLYVATLATSVLVLTRAFAAGNRLLAYTTAFSVLCLLLDTALMVRGNLPLNHTMDAWTTTRYPADWESYRTKWFRIFRARQAALLAGFGSLLIGAAYGS